MATTNGTEPYNPGEIEPRAHALWERLGVFLVRDAAETPKEKRTYCLDMFPYPSGEGLHVGHVEGYTATDIYVRYLRMRGSDVLHPMGWDAFGLPAENAAIKQQTHPRVLVEKNVARFTEQLKRLGFSYDWNRAVNTTDPQYYRWTQWIFLKLFHLGLAYEAVIPINWCPSCKTGLANEEVIDGKCERCGTVVTKKDLRQWMLRITTYADRLLRDLDQLDWPEGIKELQRNWIGRSEGLEEEWQVDGMDLKLKTFTTWPHTTWGATFMVIAPEHPVIQELVRGTSAAEGTVEFCQRAIQDKMRDQTNVEKEKEGFFLGRYVINHLSGRRMPLFVANFAIYEYGTGMVKCTPAHDQRDFEFAKKYGLDLVPVIAPLGGTPLDPATMTEAYTGEGTMMNAGPFDGMSTAQARKEIGDHAVEKGNGRWTVNYKLRDWVFSRQRYWGEPIPLVHCPQCGVVPVPEEQLPVFLPEVERYEPTGTGESPLAAIPEWVNTTCPRCAGPAKRETNTMPQWAGSCWYFLRFCDPHNAEEPWSWSAVDRWMPVSLYVGGAEHAVLHLLYARFWVKALYDGGYVPMEEPFRALRNQGTILGPDGQKMSKSRGNVVSPDEIVSQYGADTLRLYEMFLGPLEASKPWDPKSVPGVYRFLKRVWRMGERVGSRDTPHSLHPVRRALHKLIKKVGADIEALKFNTAIAAMMEFLNLVEKDGIAHEDFQTFLVVLSPFAPHTAEGLWQQLVAKKPWDAESVVQQRWPTFDQTLVTDEEVRVVIQVDGRVRGTITVARDLPDATVRDAAEHDASTRKWLGGKRVDRVVVVPNRLVNFVTAPE